MIRFNIDVSNLVLRNIIKEERRYSLDSYKS